MKKTESTVSMSVSVSMFQYICYLSLTLLLLCGLIFLLSSCRRDISGEHILQSNNVGSQTITACALGTSVGARIQTTRFTVDSPIQDAFPA
jgi:hypothetical protein